MDVVNRWFDRLPGPVWAGYVGASAIAIAVSSAATIWTGPSGATALLGLVYYAALPFAILGLIERLDRTATEALAAIRPLLQLDHDELAAAHHSLTVIGTCSTR